MYHTCSVEYMYSRNRSPGGQNLGRASRAIAAAKYETCLRGSSPQSPQGIFAWLQRRFPTGWAVTLPRDS